jgi:hypothetical protein
MKKYLPYIISSAMLIAGFLLMTKCESPQDPIDNNQNESTLLISKITNKVENGLIVIDRQNDIIDSLKHLKPKYTKGKDRVRDSLIYISDSICAKNLTLLDKECQRVDSINLAIISEQETQMIKYSEVVGLMQERNDVQEKRHVSDSTTIHTLDKKLKRTRKLAVIGIGAAFIGGLIIK